MVPVRICKPVFLTESDTDHPVTEFTRMSGHHLILGKLTDYITGETLYDTHDERYRQNLARLLIDKKGYDKNDIIPRSDLLIRAGKNRAIIKVDYKISIGGKICMLIKYGPGSLVTRQRPALAASRLLAPYQVPVVVVTNGNDAEILDGKTGKVVARGLDAIPSKQKLTHTAVETTFDSVTLDRAEMESRILYAFEVDGSCPCDDNICKL